MPAFANAHAHIQLQAGDEGSPLPLAFDSAGEARYPGQRVYLRGDADDRGLIGTIMRRGDTLHIERPGRRASLLPAAALLSAGEAPAACRWIVGDLEVRRRPCIRGTGIQIDNEEPILKQQLDEADDAFASVVGGGDTPGRQIVPVSPDDHEAARLLGDAVGAVRDLWPEAYEDLVFFTQLVVPYASDGGPTSWTEPSLPGVTVQQVRPYAMPAMAASLLHENAHTRFSALTRLFRTHRNDGTERLPSPWRPDLRPITGILLGTHAFAIAAQFYYRAIRAQLPWAKDLEPQLHGEVQRLRQGLCLLRQHADLTPFGAKFVEGLADSIDVLWQAGWGR